MAGQLQSIRKQQVISPYKETMGDSPYKERTGNSPYKNNTGDSPYKETGESPYKETTEDQVGTGLEYQTLAAGAINTYIYCEMRWSKRYSRAVYPIFDLHPRG